MQPVLTLSFLYCSYNSVVKLGWGPKYYPQKQQNKTIKTKQKVLSLLEFEYCVFAKASLEQGT